MEAPQNLLLSGFLLAEPKLYILKSGQANQRARARVGLSLKFPFPRLPSADWVDSSLLLLLLLLFRRWCF